MTDDDSDLRAQLRAADPARRLPTLGPEGLNREMEQLMSDTTRTAPTGADTHNARTRIPRWMPVAGIAAALAIAAAIVAPLALGGSEPTVEALAPPTGGDIASGSCLTLEPATIAAQEQAFAATVIAVDGDTVTLDVTETFAGEVSDRVTVTQVDATSSDFSGVPFVECSDYLVGAIDGAMTGCGVTGEDTPELRAFYDAAFAG